MPGAWLNTSGQCHFSLLWEHSRRPARFSVGSSRVTEVRVQSPCLPGLGAQWVSRGGDMYASYENPGLRGISPLLCGSASSLESLSSSLGCMSCHFLFSAWRNSFFLPGSEQKSSRVTCSLKYSWISEGLVCFLYVYTTLCQISITGIVFSTMTP